MWALGGTGGYTLKDEDGEETASGDLAVQSAHGLHLAAYLVPTRAFHIGAFVHKLNGQVLTKSEDDDEDVASFDDVNFGVAMKAGGDAGRAFISFALDLGLASLIHAAPVQRGLWFHPRFQVDIMAVRDTPMKAAVFLGFGPAIMVVAGPDEPGDKGKAHLWTIAPAFQLGGSFGG